MCSLLRQLGGEPLAAAWEVNLMAEGDLSPPISFKGNDHVSLLAQLKHMQSSIYGLVVDVRSNAESLATASTQISQGNQDLSQKNGGAGQFTSANLRYYGTTGFYRQ